MEQVGAPFVAQLQAAAAEEPRKTPLHYPPVPSQSRGRPGRSRGPLIAGMASTRGSNCRASWALAAERWMASGIPFRSTSRWYLDPGSPRSTGFGPVCSPPFGPDTQGIEARPAPVDGGVISQPIEQPLVQPLPDPGCLPIPQPSPASGPTAAAQFVREQPPRAAGSQHEHDARQSSAIREARAATFRFRRLMWQQGLDRFPKGVRNQG